MGKHPIYIDKAGKNAVQLTYTKDAGSWQSSGIENAGAAGNGQAEGGTSQ